MILLGVVSDIVVNFAIMLDDEKHTHGCVIILKHQHIKKIVSYKCVYVSRRQWYVSMCVNHFQTLLGVVSRI